MLMEALRLSVLEEQARRERCVCVPPCVYVCMYAHSPVGHLCPSFLFLALSLLGALFFLLGSVCLLAEPPACSFVDLFVARTRIIVVADDARRCVGALFLRIRSESPLSCVRGRFIPPQPSMTFRLSSLLCCLCLFSLLSVWCLVCVIPLHSHSVFSRRATCSITHSLIMHNPPPTHTKKRQRGMQFWSPWVCPTPLGHFCSGVMIHLYIGPLLYCWFVGRALRPPPI